MLRFLSGCKVFLNIIHEIMRQTTLGILFLLLSFYCTANGDSLMCRFDEVAEELDKISQFQGTEADLLVEELYQIAQQLPDVPSLTNRYLYWKAAVNYAQGVSDADLISTLEKRLETQALPPSKQDEALLNYALAISHTVSGDYGNGFAKILYALGLYRELNDKKFIVKSLMIIGAICVAVKNYNMAEEYYREAAELVDPSQKEYYQAYINRYRLYFFAQRSADATDSLSGFIPQLKQYQDTGMVAVAYLNLGASYSVNGIYDTACLYYDSVRYLTDQVDNKALMCALYQNYGIYYYQMKDMEKSHSCFMHSKEIAERIKNPEQQADALNNLSYTFSALGMYDSAYHYLRKHQDLSRQLTNNSKAIDAYQAYISVFLESSENKLIIAEQEIELRNRWLLSTIIIAVAIVAVTVLLLIVVRQQKRMKERENEELAARLKQEEEILKLQKKALKSQEREIASSSLLLSSKNNLLHQISKLAHTISSEQEELKEIKSIIKSNVSTNSDWKNFLLHFEKVHPGFFNKLKSQSDELTKNDLKMSAYMRIGMDSKQIAQILNVSHGSVRMHRYRIKKKLGLGEEDNLDDFLRNV